MNVRFYILTILLMSSLLASSAKEVNSVSYMDFTDGANEVEEYAYDANGNMTMDLNRGIESITYDWNNMPREITFTSGAKTRYTYDAAGRKLRAEYITPLAASANYALGPTPPIVPPLTLYDLSTVDYHGDCVLRNDSLERVLTLNGYIASDTLHYYIKDYQGNVRSIVRQDGAVVESTEYYPYGGLFSATASVQPFKYNAQPLARRSGRCNVGCKPVATAKTTFGNELDRTHGLDLYDSEARWYDSLLGRTSTMDPLADKYYSLSPYLWCAGNPVNVNDVDGKTITALIEDNEFFIRKDIDGFYKLFDKYNKIYIPNRDSYGSNLISDINSIASATNGNDLLTFLVNNENNVSIISSSDGFFANIANNIIGYDETDSEGGLSYFYTSGYGTTRPQYIALAHELAHIEDLWKGSFDTSTWYNSGNAEIYNAEKYAVYIENRIRREHNQPLRLYYEHFTFKSKDFNIYFPIQVSRIELCLSDYIYLLKNYSR